ncbi:MAG TPA: molybdopterin converting factor subunit 1 [Cerasibacillus sp.]|uniref:molybdopterin converting factor subunit 1 n=1 Tax=Cerasibacillus sp. TaxID=2498711 RepID=UPI002F3F1796
MIDVLLFAQLREDTGKEKISIQAEGMTVKELKQKLFSIYKIQTSAQIMVAINEEYVLEDERIEAGDTVAFIPPVSGG